MRDINVWAYHSDFGSLCPNAALDDSTGLRYPSGNRQGQADWHVAVQFGTLHELADKLTRGLPMPSQFCGNWFQDCEPVKRGEIVRLALMSHGDQGGRVMVDGRAATSVLTATTARSFHTDLHNIGLYTRERGSTILLMGCLAGQGRDGTALLVELSRVWPGRRVVGFTTIGYRHPGEMKRRGDPCELPGMRDTDAPAGLYADPRRFDSLWRDFTAMPWAAESSIHAKVVFNGAVVRCPPDEVCTP